VIPGEDREGEVDPGGSAHCVFDPPVANPDDYLTTDPPCWIAGTDQQGKLVTSIVGSDVSMDE
jgi:hypothetical protein